MPSHDPFYGLTRDQRLTLVGARIHELETRTPGAIDSDKLHRAEAMLWTLIEGDIPAGEWLSFCLGDKLHKYLKEVQMNKDQQFSHNLETIEALWQNCEHAFSGMCDEIHYFDTGEEAVDGYALRIGDGEDLSVEFTIDEITEAVFDDAQKAVIITKDRIPYRLNFFRCMWPGEDGKICST